MAELWLHQKRGIEAVLQAILGGIRRVVLSSPTGGGKSRMACELIDRWLDEGLTIAVYTRRRVLIEQLSRVLKAHGIEFGTRAAGVKKKDRGDRFARVQIMSMQTEDARVLKGDMELYPAERVIVDECHDCTGPVAAKILDAHHEDGAAYVGLSATPLGLAGLYDLLIQAGSNSELRACGALAWADHYAPDEPDMRAHNSLMPGNLPTDPQNRKIMQPPKMFGRMLEHLRKLNPELKPTILFASGVAESLWFAEQLSAAGIPSAHIDGDSVWMGGKFYRADKKAREAVLSGSKDGAIRCLCNRFVLREGVDAPWLRHGVFATVFGSLQAYLQSGGRLLRNHAGLSSVTIQDHGGNWWRHGSLNADRTWNLQWTGEIERGLREDRQRGKPQPGLCPKCGLVLSAARCRLCGWEASVWKKSKPVMQTDGTLREMTGDSFKPRREFKRPDGPARWKRMYYRARSKKWNATFRQAFAMFAQENDWGWPSKSWPLMPREALDDFRRVADVPYERLVPEEVRA